MDCLVEMVCREVKVIRKKGKQPCYLVGATARGQATLRKTELDREDSYLSIEDLIFLRTDDHVRVWWSAGESDHLDLLVVVRRTNEAQLGLRDLTPPRFDIPMLPSTLFVGVDDSTEVEEEGGENEREEGELEEEELEEEELEEEAEGQRGEEAVGQRDEAEEQGEEAGEQEDEAPELEEIVVAGTQGGTTASLYFAVSPPG